MFWRVSLGYDYLQRHTIPDWTCGKARKPARKLAETKGEMCEGDENKPRSALCYRYLSYWFLALSF